MENRAYFFIVSSCFFSFLCSEDIEFVKYDWSAVDVITETMNFIAGFVISWLVFLVRYEEIYNILLVGKFLEIDCIV